MSSAPAAIQRNDAIRSGGIVSSAIRIARYVVPHTRHTTTHAAQRPTAVHATAVSMERRTQLRP